MPPVAHNLSSYDYLTELDELKFAFNCLFQDCHFGDTVVEDADSHAKKIDAEAVFKQMDKDNLGRIDIDKFKVRQRL